MLSYDLAWVARAGTSVGLDYPGVVAAANGKVYATGNCCYSAWFGEYEPASDTWTSRAPIPTPRIGLGLVAASNGKLYAIGGEHYGAMGAVEEYDPVADRWTTRASLPTPRWLLGVAAASNGTIYAIGGCAQTGQPLATVEEYNPATNTWTTRASVPRSLVDGAAVAASNGKVYVFGGRGSNGFLATAQSTSAYEMKGAGQLHLPVRQAGYGRSMSAQGAWHPEFDTRTTAETGVRGIRGTANRACRRLTTALAPRNQTGDQGDAIALGKGERSW